jgi:hypothetical protein
MGSSRYLPAVNIAIFRDPANMTTTRIHSYGRRVNRFTGTSELCNADDYIYLCNERTYLHLPPSTAISQQSSYYCRPHCSREISGRSSLSTLRSIPTAKQTNATPPSLATHLHQPLKSYIMCTCSRTSQECPGCQHKVLGNLNPPRLHVQKPQRGAYCATGDTQLV